MRATSEVEKKRRWPKYVLATLLILVGLFYIGGGWYFSNALRDDLLVVQPPTESYDLQVVAVGEGSIRLLETDGNDDELRSKGVYGLTWEGGVGQLDEIIAAEAIEVTRAFTVLEGNAPSVGDSADANKNLYPPDPQRAHGVEFEEVVYGSPLGPMAAWLVPGDTDTWAVMVHGKGADRDETLRIMAPFIDAGHPVLSIRYRNDLDSPLDPSGYYQYGVTEWQDVEGAVQFAVESGAAEVILVGLSTGAAHTTSFLDESTLRGKVIGAVYDSPNIDVEAAVDFAASQRSLPVIGTDIPTSLVTVAKFFAQVRFGLDWNELDYIPVASNVNFRMLVFHGTADDTVPLSVSASLEESSRFGVTLIKADDGLHVGSWNIAPEAYETAVSRYLQSLGRG
ncbi:MAG: hypothetical protein ACR2NL_09795 [Acidimicrobiia bacterium]